MPKLSAYAGTRAHSMSTWSALDLAEQRSPCRDAQRQRAAPAIIANQNRGSSHDILHEIICMHALHAPRIMHLAKPPTTPQKRPEGLRQRHFACSLFSSSGPDACFHDPSAGMRFMGFTGREVFFSMLQPMFAPTALAQIWRVFGHGHENLFI